MQNFEYFSTKFEGAYFINPFVAEDNRGGFIKDYNINLFEQNGIQHSVKEVFYTLSHKGVIRAIHFQEVKQQAKLVRCLVGHVYDVIVDLRKESPTFGQWQGFDLSEKNNAALYVPEHFGHGYLVLEDSIVSYQCNEVFYGEYDSGIKWNDADIAIQWPLDKIGGEGNLIISEKDKSLQSFKAYVESGCR